MRRGRERERETKRGKGYLPFADSQITSTGSRSFISASHMGGRAPDTWPILDCSLKTIIKELDWKWSNGTGMNAFSNAGVTGGSFCCFTKSVPFILYVNVYL